MGTYAQQLKAVSMAKQKLDAKTFRLIEKAAKSDDPEDMIVAANVMKDVQHKGKNEPKAFFIDPLQFTANLGYKDKAFSLTYMTLKKMSKTPIISAIIKTRKNQIADFAEPQGDRYSTGFVIRKKPIGGINQEMDVKDKKIANAITDFILNCGGQSSWTNDDFDTFIRKIVEDSLTYDQMTFECIRNRRGKLESFLATDGATFRIAESAFRKDYEKNFFDNRGGVMWNQGNFDKFENIDGYYPQYVQVYQNAVVNNFYPWELCFGVRNPSTSIYTNGYGCSELEELINIITSMLWGDEYNRRFFSQGSAPKGFIKIKGVNNEAALQQFKQQWQSMISGVMQSWKTPVLEADADWVDLQKNNRDMEYSTWMEYLIKQSCAIYSIDPSEIGWDISRSSGSGGLFEKSDADRIKNSKDKGLYPILKFIQRKINKYIVSQLNPDFEFVFMGLNGMTIDQELEMDIKKTSSFMTINETRQKWDLPKIENGDIIENSIYYQSQQAAKQQEQQSQQQQFQQEQGGGGENPFDAYSDEENDNEDNSSDEEDEGSSNDENPFEASSKDTDEEPEEEKSESNVFVKAFEAYLDNEQNNIKE